MAKKKRGPAPLIAVITSAIALAGLTYYAIQVRDNARPPKTDTNQSAQSQPDTVKVPKPKYNGNDLDLNDSETQKVPQGEDAMVVAMNAYLRSIPAVPKEAHITHIVRRGKLVELHFSPEIITGYGSEDERTIIQGILKTASQFPDVDQVVFMAEGQPLETLGHADLTAPLDVPR